MLFVDEAVSWEGCVGVSLTVFKRAVRSPE
jgi:hypothetical protein